MLCVLEEEKSKNGLPSKDQLGCDQMRNPPVETRIAIQIGRYVDVRRHSRGGFAAQARADASSMIGS